MSDLPNIVLLLTDTQGMNAVGAVGEGYVDTPAIDRLAADGVSFGRAYGAAPVCTPARACLFTGRYPHAAGGWTNNVRLYQDVTRMGEIFAAAGYRTAYVGKWHLDGDYFGNGVAAEPYEQEFWYDGADYREEVGEEFWDWWRSAMMGERTAEHAPETIREQGITREDTWAGRVTDHARAFIEDVDDDQPYFLVVSYDEPHEPSLCPPEYAEMYVDDPYPLPDNYEHPTELTEHGKPAHHSRRAEAFANGEFFIDSLSTPETGTLPRPVYFGCASFVDDEIGRVVSAVDAHDPQHTVVTYTSDHGHHLGAHGLDSKWATMYEEVVNVPLVVRYPAELPAGECRSAVTSHVDLLPTFLDLAGVETEASFHGRSMRPALVEDDAHREAALVEYHSFASGRTDGDGFFPIRCLVTNENEKLVVNLFTSDELYDLDDDPDELRNRIDDPVSAARRDELHDGLLARMADTDDPFQGECWRDRTWRTT